GHGKSRLFSQLAPCGRLLMSEAYAAPPIWLRGRFLCHDAMRYGPKSGPVRKLRTPLTATRPALVRVALCRRLGSRSDDDADASSRRALSAGAAFPRLTTGRRET